MRLYLLLLTFLFSTILYASNIKTPPLDMTFGEYQEWYQQIKMERYFSLTSQQIGLSLFKIDNPKINPSINSAIDGGEKMSQWLKEINKYRSLENQLRLTNGESRGSGIPISSPSKYGPTTIETRYDKLMNEMPKSIKKVVYGSAKISKDLPLDEETFVKWCRDISYLYQTAVRWTGMSKWLDYYAERRKNDIRGFYHLNRENNLDQKLRDFASLESEKQEFLITHLEGLCYNKLNNTDYCKRIVENAADNGTLLNVKNEYWKTGQMIWDSFFKINNPRSDIVWNKDDSTSMHISFTDPDNQKIADWLKENVEDEFKRDNIDWRTEMDFIPGESGTAYLKFEPNVTPHVSGGNIVVMDANTPLEEFSTRWTIRHEFGHILRLPDCYFEFYVPEENLMVNYQLDVTDLMCSRSGDMNDRIYKELKRAYYQD